MLSFSVADIFDSPSLFLIALLGPELLYSIASTILALRCHFFVSEVEDDRSTSTNKRFGCVLLGIPSWDGTLPFIDSRPGPRGLASFIGWEHDGKSFKEGNGI